MFHDNFYDELGRGIVTFIIVMVVLVGLVCLGIGVLVGWLLA